MIELREPLATVLRGAVRLMVNGISGTAGQGELENFAAHWKTQPKDCIAFLAQETEVMTRGRLTIRAVHPGLFSGEAIPVPYQLLAACYTSGAPPLEEVLADELYLALYVLLLPSEPAHGVKVRRVRR